MRRLRVLLAPAAALWLTGCGYVHFGRLPQLSRPLADTKAIEAYTNLSTEHKILKQELVLARREGDALRLALERAGSSTSGLAAAPAPAAPPPDLVARLGETSAELAALRASYAKLQAERSARAPAADAALHDLEEKLAASQRDHTALQAENVRLRAEIDTARRENTGLADQLRDATRRYDEAQAAVAQLDRELLALKQTRAEPAVETAHPPSAPPREPAAMPAPVATLSALQSAKEPPAPPSATAELHLSVDRLRQQAAPALTTPAESTPVASAPVPAPPATGTPPPVAPPTSAASSTSASTPAAAARKHTVAAGDTLEKISQRYYGAPDRWPAIYAANADLLGSGLRPGMELTIPD